MAADPTTIPGSLRETAAGNASTAAQKNHAGSIASQPRRMAIANPPSRIVTSVTWLAWPSMLMIVFDSHALARRYW